jgi:putative ABC transport system substrate-binding protein
VRKPDELARAFESVGHLSALVVIQDALTVAHRERIVQLLASHRLPAIYGSKLYVEAGGLIAYGASLEELYPRAAIFKLEAGRQDSSLTTITALARALGVPVSELLA